MKKKHELLQDMQSWAIKFNIPHLALNELSTILNKRLSNVLPKLQSRIQEKQSTSRKSTILLMKS